MSAGLALAYLIFKPLLYTADEARELKDISIIVTLLECPYVIPLGLDI